MTSVSTYAVPFTVAFLLLSLGLFKFSLNIESLLSSLITLEFIALSVYLSLMVLTSNNVSEMYISLIFLTVVVCDSVMGISIMLLSARIMGSQAMANSSMSMW